MTSDVEMLESAPGTSTDKGKAREAKGTLPLDSLPWVEKYRPKALTDVVAHQDIILTSTAIQHRHR